LYSAHHIKADHRSFVAGKRGQGEWRGYGSVGVGKLAFDEFLHYKEFLRDNEHRLNEKSGRTEG
jgi:hypothetical protein